MLGFPGSFLFASSLRCFASSLVAFRASSEEIIGRKRRNVLSLCRWRFYSRYRRRHPLAKDHKDVLGVQLK